MKVFLYNVLESIGISEHLLAEVFIFERFKILDYFIDHIRGKYTVIFVEAPTFL